MSKQEGGKQVNVEGLAPILAREAAGATQYLGGGVVDEGIEAMAIQGLANTCENFGSVSFVFNGAGQIGLNVVGAW